MLDGMREHLIWTGTPPGGNSVQSLFVKNASEVNSMLLCLTIDDAKHFKFKLVSGETVSSIELDVPTRAERSVDIVFLPSSVCVYHSSVAISPCVRHDISARKETATIPLSGYAGSSDVQIHVNARDPTGNPCLNLNTAGPGNTRLSNFSIANIGQRSAYIKLLAFSDHTCTQQLSTQQCSLHPCEFLLRAAESRQVSTVSACQSASSTVAVVLVLSGDEALRQALKHCYGTAPYHQLDITSNQSPSLRAINFLNIYDGEQISNSENIFSYSLSVKRCEDLFYSNMKQTKLPLKYLNAVNNSMSSFKVKEEKIQSINGFENHITDGNLKSKSLPELKKEMPLELTTRSGSDSCSGHATSQGDTHRQLMMHCDSGRPLVLVSTTRLEFEPTPIGLTSQSQLLTFVNMCNRVLSWNLYGYSPPYAIKAGNKRTRCGYEVFKALNSSGILKAKQTSSATIQFVPPYHSQLVQNFQFLCKPHFDSVGTGQMEVYTQKIEVWGTGCGSETPATLRSPRHLVGTSRTHSPQQQLVSVCDSERYPTVQLLYVSDTQFHFKHWSVCHKLVVANRNFTAHTLEYKVSGPFKVVCGAHDLVTSDFSEGRMLVPSNRYVHMSVYFTPDSLDTFAGSLELWVNAALPEDSISVPQSLWSHNVTLTGVCDQLERTPAQ